MCDAENAPDGGARQAPKGPLDPDEFARRYEAAAVDRVRDQAHAHLIGARALLSRCASPIELALGQRLVLRYCNVADKEWFGWPWSFTTCADHLVATADTFSREAFEGRHFPESFVMLDTQVQIGEPAWRVDFLLVAFCLYLPGLPLKVIIECDGHDFHERTPEQAERDRGRDRDAQLGGYRVLRFTGREIWRDAAACVEQVDLYVRDHAMRCSALGKKEAANG